MKRLLTFVALALLPPLVASAGPESGSSDVPIVSSSIGELLRTCQSPNPTEKVACVAYLEGALSAAETEQSITGAAWHVPKLICRHSYVNGAKLRSIVLGEAAVQAAANQLNAQDPPGSLVYLAFMKAFQCKKAAKK